MIEILSHQILFTILQSIVNMEIKTEKKHNKEMNYGEALREKLRIKEERAKNNIFNRIFDFIFTYLCPIKPLILSLDLKGILLLVITIFLGLMLFTVNFGGAARGAILGLLFWVASYFIVATNINIAYLVFFISLSGVYILGYYHLLKKK